MNKKIIAIILAVLTVVAVMLPVSFAEDTKLSEIYTDFKSYEAYDDGKGNGTYTYSYTASDNAAVTMEVLITPYFDESSTSNDALILYVINHTGETIGTEEDFDIIDDFLLEGYVVAVLDFQNSEYAKSPYIETCIQTIRADMRGVNSEGKVEAGLQKYLGSRNNKINDTHTYVVPSGYRLARDVVYFKLATEGSQKSLDEMVAKYNTQGGSLSTLKKMYNFSVTEDGETVYPYRNTWVTKNSDGVYILGDEYKAKTVYDIMMKDGTTMTDEDMYLRLDIVYPSMPTKEAPVAMLAASGTPRGNNGVKINRQHNVGFLFRGYATVCYDHEYYAYLNTDAGGWGHDEPSYTFQGYDGVKSHTAAVRCVKYYADEYGYSNTKIGVYGHSKSSYSSLLTNPDAENILQSPALGEQPFLKDKDGNPITAEITCAYHSMGNGSSRYARYLTSQNVPTIICCGQNDSGTGCNYWEAEKAAYIKSGIEHLAIDMIDLGHDYPNGDDPVFDYNRYDAFCKFFDYYLKDTAPELLYTSISEGQLKKIVTTKNPIGSHTSCAKTGPWTIEEGDELYVQFLAPITEWSFLEAVSLKDADGNEVAGSWYAQGNGNKWIFDGKLSTGKTYILTVADNTAKDKYGRAVAEGIEISFTK